MHLLAAQPGGFVDDEGIVDLCQSPADIIILSAADSTLAALANGAEQLTSKLSSTLPSVRLANWMQLLKPAAYDLYEQKTLSQARVVIVSLLGGESYWRYGYQQLQAWQAAAKNRTLIVVPGDDAEDKSLIASSSCSYSDAVRVWQYLRQGGAANISQLFRFIIAHYFAQPVQWQEPKQLPHCMMYMPGSSLKNFQATLQDWRERWVSPHQSVCVVLFYKSHLQSSNTTMFDELINTLEKQGLQPLPIAIASLKDAESITLVNALIAQANVKLIINTTGFASHTVSSPDLASQPTSFISPFKKDIPVLQLILSSSTEDDWLNYSQGLRSRDIAMQVILPEMDGRIITRAVSFKTQAYRCELCEISIVRYVLHKERASFIAKLAKRYIDLATLPNQKKRIGIILANYPTKDGRIGNGVGLDTPQSTINLLQALAQDNYPVENIPDNGTDLIKALLGAVTNNPNTLHNLPCWQSISVENYLRYFAQLPEANQQAVIKQWGAPKQDPKFRNGRIMLAGIRLGETFIGIQPARGFNMDILANYHDPDLIPPHSYLAFYFWLRFEYQVNAIVHVGKHGNLEWLPGKGSALSSTCWPDIALGPMPHFYPFIVNDPGEGAQAKRRAQAVIIDHLMPPMTRAEVYGELAELEGLVDEYYQAMGMDTRREKWLKEKIIEHVSQTNLINEIQIETGQNAVKNNRQYHVNDNDILNELDTFLCDIKEAQIRHGLHVLGQLPNTEKLSDTLVALLRLPRGSSPNEQGILNNLSVDLKLIHNGEIFDPLQQAVELWKSDKPAVLLTIVERTWRTTADARERLELLAMQLIKDHVLDGLATSSIEQDFPNTTQQLNYTCSTLLQALNTSVDLEIQSLLKGLSGRFVEPGPSGAPTRGRLDTLPTGRNFYSVDNRSIPSPAAWAIGERSAQTLIEKHLQEQGDYPKHIGLSVWGTATMRTGGDDIAQAFALMGIKPVWASGSYRVIDFEIIPVMLLNRPRIDVTLRVSGFFRDAFPNVMRLFDAAVIALQNVEEPNGLNTIRENIEQRKAQLIAQGLTPQLAERQASFRVFGSKPGAYGAGLQGLIDERCWENAGDLAQAYVNWGSYAYGNDQQSKDGIAAASSFTHQLSKIDLVMQNQDNREHDILDSDDYYQFQGGMTNAVQHFSNQTPLVYHNDHSNPSQPKIRTLKQELNRVMRSRVLNPKWINAMREHGYKGAFEMAASVDYLFAYDATTNLIDDYQYKQVADSLIFDQQNQMFLQENNPAALEEMSERLLEACQRGLWQQPNGYDDRLQDLLLGIDAQQEGIQ